MLVSIMCWSRANHVNAGSVVLTGVRLAVINLSVTQLPSVARGTVAGESRWEIIARGTILTGRRITVIYLNVTVLPCVAKVTHTSV